MAMQQLQQRSLRSAFLSFSLSLWSERMCAHVSRRASFNFFGAHTPLFAPCFILSLLFFFFTPSSFFSPSRSRSRIAIGRENNGRYFRRNRAGGASATTVLLKLTTEERASARARGPMRTAGSPMNYYHRVDSITARIAPKSPLSRRQLRAINEGVGAERWCNSRISRVSAAGEKGEPRRKKEMEMERKKRRSLRLRSSKRNRRMVLIARGIIRRLVKRAGVSLFKERDRRN